jgi:hypothetical protein
MNQKTNSKNSNTELTAKLYLALDDLTLALATCDDENIRKSEVFKKALEVAKVVKEMRNLQVESKEEVKNEQNG